MKYSTEIKENYTSGYNELKSECKHLADGFKSLAKPSYIPALLSLAALVGIVIWAITQ